MRTTTAAILAALCSAGCSGESDEYVAGDLCSENARVEAYVQAQIFVEDYLTAPATADYPTIAGNSEVRVVVSDCRWTIVSWVDSQNGFGTTLRTSFIVIQQAEGERWRLLNLAFDGETVYTDPSLL